MSQSSEVTINNCTFSGNVAHHGGGFFNHGGKVTINNCTFSVNTAYAWGGGLYNNFGEATITFSTFVNNTASVAGGLAAGYPPLRISATIVANNTARFGKQHNGSGQMTSLGFNLESGTDCAFSTLPNDHQNTDPMIDPTGLQNNGGSTQTIVLQKGSPAVGAIPIQLCPPTDQRGYLCPEGLSFCDIGAYQSSYLAPLVQPSP